MGSVGARRREILFQFLAEAVFISLSGGVLGILVGLAVPLSARLFVEGLHIPISKPAIVIAFLVSALVGIIFGIVPANRASKLKPTEALRYEWEVASLYSLAGNG